MIDWKDPANDRMLLLALVSTNDRYDWAAVASSLGGKFTAHGIR